MPNIMPKKRARTQSAILKSASKLFIKLGYDETSMESIAEKSEISAGTLYNYYNSKSVLLIAIFAEMTREIRLIPPKRHDDIMSEKSALAELTDILKMLVRSTILFPKKIMRQIFAQLFILDASDVAELAAMDMEIVGMLLPILRDMQAQGIIATDTDIEAAAMLLFGSSMMQHQAYISLEAMTKEQLDNAITGQVKMILHGLFKR